MHSFLNHHPNSPFPRAPVLSWRCPRPSLSQNNKPVRVFHQHKEGIRHRAFHGKRAPTSVLGAPEELRDHGSVDGAVVNSQDVDLALAIPAAFLVSSSRRRHCGTRTQRPPPLIYPVPRREEKRRRAENKEKEILTGSPLPSRNPKARCTAPNRRETIFTGFLNRGEGGNESAR